MSRTNEPTPAVNANKALGVRGNFTRIAARGGRAARLS